MACRYHPSAAPAGKCKDCKNEFCQECAIEIIRHGTVCLDCGTRFARKKLRQAYWAAAIGLAFGIVISAMFISERQWLMALWPPIVYPYFFPAVFFGFHYGGKIWIRLGAFADRFSGFPGMVASIFFLALRLAVAVYLGVFGGGIVQFLRYRKMIASQENLAAAISGSAAPAMMTASVASTAAVPAVGGGPPSSTVIRMSGSGPSVPTSPPTSQAVPSPATAQTRTETGNGQSCPACGAPVPPLAQFCLHCGSQVQASYEIPPPSTSLQQRSAAAKRLPIIAVATVLAICLGVAGFLAISQYLGSRAKNTPAPTVEGVKTQSTSPPPAISSTPQPVPQTETILSEPSGPQASPPVQDHPVSIEQPPVTQTAAKPQDPQVEALKRDLRNRQAELELEKQRLAEQQKALEAQRQEELAQQAERDAERLRQDELNRQRQREKQQALDQQRIQEPTNNPQVQAHYQGPTSGTLVWEGEVAGAELITIENGTASSGRVAGILPGVPCLVQSSDPKRVSVATAPGPSNQWKRIVLRIQGKGHMTVKVTWSLP